MQKSGPNEHEDIGRMVEEIRKAREEDDRDEADAVARAKKAEKVREAVKVLNQIVKTRLRDALVLAVSSCGASSRK